MCLRREIEDYLALVGQYAQRRGRQYGHSDAFSQLSYNFNELVNRGDNAGTNRLGNQDEKGGSSAGHFNQQRSGLSRGRFHLAAAATGSTPGAMGAYAARSEEDDDEEAPDLEGALHEAKAQMAYLSAKAGVDANAELGTRQPPASGSLVDKAACVRAELHLERLSPSETVMVASALLHVQPRPGEIGEQVDELYKMLRLPSLSPEGVQPTPEAESQITHPPGTTHPPAATCPPTLSSVTVTSASAETRPGSISAVNAQL